MIHIMGMGKTVAYCAFETGTAQVGATVFNGGTLLGITPLETEAFGSLDALCTAFHIDNAESQWEYLDTISNYPVPRGIF